MATFISKLEKGEHDRIVALGTSLTGGTCRWIDVIEEWLSESYPRQVSIDNLGIGAPTDNWTDGCVISFKFLYRSIVSVGLSHHS